MEVISEEKNSPNEETIKSTSKNSKKRRPKSAMFSSAKKER